MGLRSQTVTAKLGRDITAAGRICRTLPYLFVCELIFALSPIHVYYTFILAAEARDKRHPKTASPQLVIHGSSFRGPVNMGLVTRVSKTGKACDPLIESGRQLRLVTWVHHIKHRLTSLANLTSLKRRLPQGALENPYRTNLSEHALPSQIHFHGLGLRSILAHDFRS